jgi:hypothetical protein
MKYRMLALDLDGTTVLNGGGVSELDRLAVAAAMDAGIIVTIITGRLFTGTRHVAQALGIHGPVGVMNGSEIRDVKSAGKLDGSYLCDVSRGASRQVFADLGLAPFVMSPDHVHHDPIGEHHLRSLRIWTEDFVRYDDLYGSSAWDHEEGVLAVIGVGEAEAARQAHSLLKGELPGHSEVVRFPCFHTPSEFVCIRGNTNDKGTALHRIAAEYGITADECVAVGDWYNDLPMLKQAGRSFVMGSAPEELAAHATDRIAHTALTGGGVAEVIKKVWGIEEK